MHSLLDPAQYPQIPAYIGTVVAITLLGWGIGGIIGGLLADYIGRKRTMIFALGVPCFRRERAMSHFAAARPVVPACCRTGASPCNPGPQILSRACYLYAVCARRAAANAK
jgi:MFS family permease